jgi:steroid 5-alpha reductase family enzyme
MTQSNRGNIVTNENAAEKQARMKKRERLAIIAFPIVIAIGALVALIGSQGSAEVAGVPIFALVVAVAYIIQWVFAIPFYFMQTEKYFDLIGSVTHSLVVAFAFVATPETDARSLLLLGLILIWAIRLGTFLFRRIVKAGADDRWDELKQSVPRFFLVWTIQGIWISFTQAAALAAITTANTQPLGIFAIVGGIVWLIGFGIEVLADHQKSQFRADPANAERFISTGLWSRSRHPNYFGEIVLWVGIAIIAFPVLSGLQYLLLLSPVFVFVLLTRVSGVPMLEAKAERKWGGQEDYETYKRTTPVLIPRL